MAYVISNIFNIRLYVYYAKKSHFNRMHQGIIDFAANTRFCSFVEFINEKTATQTQNGLQQLTKKTTMIQLIET